MMEGKWLISFSLMVFSILIFKFFTRKQEKIKNLPPSPPALPILGHLHLMKEPMQEALHALSEKSGPVMLLRLGVRNVLVVTSPDAVEECFTKNDVVFADRPCLLISKHLNYNCTTMGAAPYGDLWRNLRRVTSQVFLSPSYLADNVSLRQDEIKMVVNQIIQSCENGSCEVDLKAKIGEITMNIISKMIMGKRYYGENIEDAKEAMRFREMMDDFLELLKLKNLGDFLPIFQWVDLQGTVKKMLALKAKMDIFFNDMIAQRRKVLSSGVVDGPNYKPTLIDNMLAMREKEPEFFTDDIINGILMMMLLAGPDSSHTTMEWLMSLLLNHPEVMTKLRSEIDSHVGSNRLIDEQDIRKLTYLQNVINETLRLYPPVPIIIPREASDDCIVGGYDIPRGTMMLVNIWAIHRHPKVWEKAEIFIPERFEGKSEGYDLIPFGGGRRGCPGITLANRMMALTIGTLIQLFDWERVGPEMVDMTPNPGFGFVKMKPLVAICKPRSDIFNNFHRPA